MFYGGFFHRRYRRHHRRSGGIFGLFCSFTIVMLIGFLFCLIGEFQFIVLYFFFFIFCFEFRNFLQTFPAFLSGYFTGYVSSWYWALGFGLAFLACLILVGVRIKAEARGKWQKFDFSDFVKQKNNNNNKFISL